MRGSLRQRSRGAWSLILERGYVVDPATGRRKRRQTWITFRGTKREAEQKLAALSSFNPTKKKFLDRTNYYGQQVEMDGQGRLLLPQLLRESGQIKGEVAVLGNLTYLVVRNLELFKKEIEEEEFTPEDEKTLDELGI